MADQIYYKVITKDRKSTIIKPSKIPEINKYYLTYNKGDIVTAPENSFGIFIFKDIQEAEKFKKDNFIGGFIVKVKPIGKIQHIKFVIEICCIDNIDETYKEIIIGPSFDTDIIFINPDIPTRFSPRGTYVCPSVEVLD